jgi:iduronate 2-sulfatase
MRNPFAVMIGLAICLGCGSILAAESAPPNVLFLVCDDLNCNIGCYGHPIVKTPNIDRLAARGIRFEHAYCQYPLCGPSRSSFMTGLYPDQTLVHSNPVFIRQHLPSVLTMAQMFRTQGYFTTRIGKIFHYGVPSNIGSGGHDDPYSWDYAINPRGRDKDDEHLIFSVRPGEYGGYLSWLAAEGTDEEQTDGIAATDAVQQIEESVRRGRRFFLAVGLYRPHTPYVAPRRYYEMYEPYDITVPSVPAGYLETLPPGARKSITKKPEHYNISKELAREAIQGYYAAVSFADAQLGRVLDALDRTGVADNTIIVFTSDHGYHLGEHRHWLKTTLFEDAAHVPLIIAGPGITHAGESTSSIAELVDIYPTLAELCGLSAPDYLSGVSLAGVLSDLGATPRTSALTQLKDNYSVRTADFRYTEWSEESGGGAELYDRRSDPEELVNLADDPAYRDTRERLSSLLRERVADSRRVSEGLEQVP